MVTYTMPHSMERMKKYTERGIRVMAACLEGHSCRRTICPCSMVKKATVDQGLWISDSEPLEDMYTRVSMVANLVFE